MFELRLLDIVQYKLILSVSEENLSKRPVLEERKRLLLEKVRPRNQRRLSLTILFEKLKS